MEGDGEAGSLSRGVERAFQIVQKQPSGLFGFERSTWERGVGVPAGSRTEYLDGRGRSS